MLNTLQKASLKQSFGSMYFVTFRILNFVGKVFICKTARCVTTSPTLDFIDCHRMLSSVRVCLSLKDVSSIGFSTLSSFPSFHSSIQSSRWNLRANRVPFKLHQVCLKVFFTLELTYSYEVMTKMKAALREDGAFLLF